MKIIITLFIPVSILGACFFSGNMPYSVYNIIPRNFDDAHLYSKELLFAKTHAGEKKYTEDNVGQNNSLVSLSIKSETQILFGDAHVYNMSSSGVLMYSLPLMLSAREAFPPN